MWGVELAVMAAMIGVNCVFAGYEIALASVTLARLQRLADERQEQRQNEENDKYVAHPRRRVRQRGGEEQDQGDAGGDDSGAGAGAPRFAEQCRGHGHDAA